MSNIDIKKLEATAKKSRYDIVRMIANAGSGHIGGSLSSIDTYVLLLSTMDENDRLVVSHGHSSAALYAALGNTGYIDVEEAVRTFRQESPYEGHPSTKVNGVEWCSGCLGQGLSVGCGFALAKKLKNEPGRVFVVMGDGEQQKGQLQEAREFAVKHNLTNLIAIVDFNGLQSGGKVADTTSQDLADKYKMSGWETVTVDGHDFELINKTLESAKGPFCILAKTVMGKGIPEIEDNYKYHGTVLNEDQKNRALESFKLTEDELKLIEPALSKTKKLYDVPTIPVKKGKVYENASDIRSAFGTALADVARENPDVAIAALDCDLEGSVKLSDFKNVRPDGFIECGIAEHNAATTAAAVSKSGVIAVHADFAIFNISETYSQNRMADINKAPVKLMCTHAGLDVGEDGKTHQCIDYIGLLSNLHGFKVIVPADANQADAAIRYAMSVPEAVAVIGGRSKMPILTLEDGSPLDLNYGKGQWLRRGKDGTVITYGSMVYRAVAAAEELEKSGISIGVINMPTPCHLDSEIVCEAAKTGAIVTYEDHNVKSGIGGGVARIICENGLSCKMKCLGVTQYGLSMPPEELYKIQGLDKESLKNVIINLLK